MHVFIVKKKKTILLECLIVSINLPMQPDVVFIHFPEKAHFPLLNTTSTHKCSEKRKFSECEAFH